MCVSDVVSHSLAYISGHETYENQMKYGLETFQELENLQRNGFVFEGIKYFINVVFCCDWKAGACIEG